MKHKVLKYRKKSTGLDSVKGETTWYKIVLIPILKAQIELNKHTWIIYLKPYNQAPNKSIVKYTLSMIP